MKTLLLAISMFFAVSGAVLAEETPKTYEAKKCPFDSSSADKTAFTKTGALTPENAKQVNSARAQ